MDNRTLSVTGMSTPTQVVDSLTGVARPTDRTLIPRVEVCLQPSGTSTRYPPVRKSFGRDQRILINIKLVNTRVVLSGCYTPGYPSRRTEPVQLGCAFRKTAAYKLQST